MYCLKDEIVSSYFYIFMSLAFKALFHKQSFNFRPAKTASENRLDHLRASS